MLAEPLSRARQPLEHRGAQRHVLVVPVHVAGVELLERRLEIRRRGAVGVALECAPSRLREVAERLAMRHARAGAREVVRQLVGVRRCALAVRALQGVRKLDVETLRTRAVECRVHDVAHERVGEIVLHVACGLLALHEQPRAPQLVQRLEDRFVRHTTHRAQRGVPHARPEHRGEIEQRPRRRTEPLDAGQHRVAYGARQRDRLHVPSRPASVALLQLPRLDERLDRLLDEEGIAARPLVQHRREAAHDVGRDVERALHQLERLLRRQRRDPLDARRTQPHERLLGVAQQRGHPVRVVVRAEHEQSSTETRRVHLPGDEVQQLERRRVGPLQVVEHEQERLARREAAQQLKERPVQPRLRLGGALAALGALAARRRERAGEDVRELGARAAREDRQRGRVEPAEHRAEGVGEHRVRHPRFHGVGPPLGHGEAAPLRRGGRGACQPRLAHPSLADEEHRVGSAPFGRGQRRLDASQLVRAADQRRSGGGRRHVAEAPVGSRL